MNQSWTHLFGSSSLGREHRKIVFAYACVLGGFFSLFFCLSHSLWASQHLGPWQASMRGLRSTWGVLPSTICDGPKFQNRLQFSKSKAQGNQGNYFPGASLILFVHVPFMQIGQTPTAKLCAVPLPRKCSWRRLKGLLSAFLISQFHTVWMVASWLRTDNVFSVLYIKHTDMNSYRSSPFLPASRKELRQLFSPHKPHL